MLNSIPTIKQLFIITLLVIWAGHGFAHKVNAFATIQDGKLQIEGYFPDGKKAKNSRIAVFDQNQKLIAKGTTDDQGRFTTDITAQGEIRVVLDAGMGHRTEATTMVSSTDSNTHEHQGGHAHGHEHGSSHHEQIETKPNNSAPLDTKQLETIIRNAMVPLERKITELQQKTQLREIISGLGYILGIFGLVMYFLSRQKKSESTSQN